MSSRRRPWTNGAAQAHCEGCGPTVWTSATALTRRRSVVRNHQRPQDGTPGSVGPTPVVGQHRDRSLRGARAADREGKRAHLSRGESASRGKRHSHVRSGRLRDALVLRFIPPERLDASMNRSGKPGTVQNRPPASGWVIGDVSGARVQLPHAGRRLQVRGLQRAPAPAGPRPPPWRIAGATVASPG
jgi:hypothetical protein